LINLITYPGGFPFFTGIPTFPANDLPTDRACFDLMVAAFKGLNLFNTVIFTTRAPEAEQFPSLWLQPWKWKEDDDDDFDVRLRTVWFRINLRVQRRSVLDQADPFDQLQSLAAAVSDAFDLISDPPWYSGHSEISEGVYPLDGSTDKTNLPKSSPISGATLIGKFVYEVRKGGRATD